MSPTWFVGRVTVGSALAGLGLSPVAAWIGGHPAVLGVLAGVALGLGSLWWLAVGVRSLSTPGGRLSWTVSAALRFSLLAVACALLLSSGLAHPVAVLVGLTVLPCALVTAGLCAARTTSE